MEQAEIYEILPLKINKRKKKRMNGDDLIEDNQRLSNQVKAKQIILEVLNKKLDIAIVGLEAIISNNSDTLKIAEKTIQEVENYILPQGTPPKEE